MGLIYIIKNTINDKVYIGQTRRTLQKRWEHHLYLADHSEAILYRAMRKHNKQNFYIEPIEEIDNDLLNEREIYWISKYNSFAPNGYNSTLGGDGVTKYNHNEIINYYLNVADKSMTKTAEHFGCHITTVLNIIQANNLEVQERGTWSFRPIVQLDLQGNFIAEYESIVAAEKEFEINGKNIYSVLNTKTHKSAYGYQWIYKEEYEPSKNYIYKKNNWRAVQCIETGQIFESTKSAVQWLKNNDNTLKSDIKGMSSNICRAIRKNIKAYKYHWKYID